MSLIVALVLSCLLTGLLVGLILGMTRGTVARGAVLAAGGGLVIALYATLMLVNQALGLEYSEWVGSQSLADARASGRLVGVYTASCSDDRIGVQEVYAEYLTRKELGPLLWPRTLTSDAVRVVSSLEPDAFSRRTASRKLEFEDGAGATVDQQTGRASARNRDLNQTSCCFDFRLRAPERFWLVQEGERVCEFTLRPSTDS